MKKTLTAFTAVAVIAGTLAMAATDASAQRRRGGWVGPAVGLGILGGIAAGAYLASRPRGYVVYEGYGAPYPAACPGGYWARRPLRDGYGNFVGWSKPRFVCP